MELNKELLTKAREAKTAEELMTLAAENDYALTEEEAKAYFSKLHPASEELSDDELGNVSGGCGGGYDSDKPKPQFAVGETVLYIHSYLHGNRITCHAKVLKRSYEGDGWYYLLKTPDGEQKMSERHILKA